jgi:hypothetical protein
MRSSHWFLVNVVDPVHLQFNGKRTAEESLQLSTSSRTVPCSVSMTVIRRSLSSSQLNGRLVLSGVNKFRLKHVWTRCH